MQSVKKILSRLVKLNQLEEPVNRENEGLRDSAQNYVPLFSMVTYSHKDVIKKIIQLKNTIAALKIKADESRVVGALLENLQSIFDNKYEDIFTYRPHYDHPHLIKHDYLASSNVFKVIQIAEGDAYAEMLKTYLKILHALANAVSDVSQKSIPCVALSTILKDFIEKDISEEKSKQYIKEIINDFSKQQVILWDDGISIISAPWDYRLYNVLKPIIAESCKQDVYIAFRQ